MFEKQTNAKNQRVGFFLLPFFSMIAFTSCIDPLRMANRLSRQKLYNWKTLSINGEEVPASNGVTIMPDGSILDPIDVDILFVCAGVKTREYRDKEISRQLRSYARADVPLGSVCTGSITLADAGLLDGYRCTLHWENVEGFVETYPHLDVTATLFEIDRNRYTCSGGTAPLDMMVFAISQSHGEQLAARVAEQLLHSTIRHQHDPQRMPIQHRTGIRNPKLLAAIAFMETNTETPHEIANVAQSVNISLRQLERLFRTQLSTTPSKYYLELRLQRSRLLLRQTSMLILHIAVASGFKSAAHFTQAYRRHFGYPPSAERKNNLSL